MKLRPPETEQVDWQTRTSPSKRTRPIFLILGVLTLLAGVVYLFQRYWKPDYYIQPWEGHLEQHQLKREQFITPQDKEPEKNERYDRVGGREADIKKQRGYRSNTF